MYVGFDAGKRDCVCTGLDMSVESSTECFLFFFVTVSLSTKIENGSTSTYGMYFRSNVYYTSSEVATLWHVRFIPSKNKNVLGKK